jgi:ribose-phosphate pyrophosphokinase
LIFSSNSSSSFRHALILGAATATLGFQIVGNKNNEYASSESETKVSLVQKSGEHVWYPNTTTKHWHFYRGKMNPSCAKSLKLFKCADTPIADEIANYLGVSLNQMEGKKFCLYRTVHVCDTDICK